MSRVTVLYEDQSNKGQIKDFGLHALLLACVADCTSGDRWQLGKQVTANLKKGNGNLYKACREEVPILTSDGSYAIALFDSDRLAELVAQPGISADAALEILHQTCRHPHLTLLPLVENLESVIRAAIDCDPSLVQSAQSALDKGLNARDKFFQRIAAGVRSVRDCIIEQVESFRTLRDRVIELLKQP